MQKHRGKHPSDDDNFREKYLILLKEAVKDAQYLLTRGYNEKSTLEIVGNRYRLNERQRKALMRMVCSEQHQQIRAEKRVNWEEVVGKTLLIDGYNVLIIMESAMSGGYIFEGLDGCYRDIASIHGSYHKVEETIPVLLMIGEAMKKQKIALAHWYFDAPVSNSGRLKTIMYELKEQYDFPWKIDLSNNPDAVLKESKEIIVTSDGYVLNECVQWVNFTRWMIDTHFLETQIVKI
jgi:hypothetical protein